MNSLTPAQKQRGLQQCRELKLDILRYQHKNARSSRERAVIAAKAKLLNKQH
ncbi:MAG: hypothetical protein ACI86X_000685 [Moritella sp.]|jgi:hypothetical protein